MNGSRFWTIANQGMTIGGFLAAAISAYYTAATYYGWDKPLPITGSGAGIAPAPQGSGTGYVALAPEHLPVWLLRATLVASLALLAVSLVMMLYRRSILKVSNPPLTPSQLYVGQMLVSFNALKKDYVIEITARSYNGSSGRVKIQKVSGNIACIAGVNQGSAPLGALPTPILKDVFATIVPGHSELMVCLEQRLPGDIATAMSERLEAGDVVQLMLKDLEIIIADETGQTARLPVWGGMMCRKVGDLGVAGQIITGEVHINLNPKAALN